MAEDSQWIERAQSAEAKLKTLQGQVESIKRRVQDFRTNFGVRENADGVLLIAYDKFVENLGMEGCLELRAIIDARYQISGKAGDKPKVRVKATK